MRYLQIDLTQSSEPVHSWLGKLLQKALPAASPDLEALYAETQFWWLEVTDSGEPLREIGFSSNGDPVVLGPIGRNCGLLLDSPIDWKGSQLDSTAATEHFEEQWAALLPRFSHLESE